MGSRNRMVSKVTTVRIKNFSTDFFKIEDTFGRHITFFIQHKLHWHIYSLLRGRTASEKLPKILLFGPTLIHQLRLLGSLQHPQSGVFLT
jgi:hypothetical protein